MAGRGIGPDFVEALARGLSVLSCFDARRPRMTLTEIADASGLARPTARRLLLTLAAAPLALGVVATVRTHSDGPSLNSALARTAKLALAFCLLLCAGILA